MEWFAAVDGYCERLGPAYWAEPINALTNLAFVLAAALMWRRSAGLGRVMCVVLGVIGVGSWLFHTHANRLTGLMDVLPILGFILLYVFAASRDMLGLKGWQAGLCVVAFVPYAAATVPLWGLVPGLGSSAGYAPVPMLILIYAWLMRGVPETARGLAVGAGILIVSLTFRTLDEPLCGLVPFGTHFMWHILNAVMLAWMIEVYRRHRLAASLAAGGAQV
ncbi:MAG: hypothetical protein ACRC14_18095 [Paracoccaceae bacterium]